MTSQLFQLAAAVARNAAATVSPALVVPPAEKRPQRVTERDYDRAQAAAAIVRAVRQWRESLAGMSNADPAEALDAVWQAGEEYDALRED